jgi:hypothetical protein
MQIQDYSYVEMSDQKNRLVLLLIALALAVAPLRGTLALPSPASAGDGSHCAGMQQAKAQDDAGPAMHHERHTGNPDRPCQAGCNGDCCDSACNNCAPSAPTTALSGEPAAAGHANGLPPGFSFNTRYTDRAIIPPLRPPASS